MTKSNVIRDRIRELRRVRASELIPHHKNFRTHPERQRAALHGILSEIGYADKVIGELYERFGWERDSIVVVVSDHGQHFGEHGIKNHERGLYRGLNDILFMISAPRLEIRGREAFERVSICDVLPTLLEMVGHRPPDGLDGLSLASLLREEQGAPDLAKRALFAHRISSDGENVSWAVMKGRWKLIREEERTMLFDTEDDVGERRDLSRLRPAVHRELDTALAAFQTEAQPLRSVRVSIDLDAEQVRYLEALGYVDRQ